MTINANQMDRVATIAEIVRKAHGPRGRTALMKGLYFLQELKKVPLGYSFRLYTYGPFDADVLEDLRYAESLGAVSSTVVSYPGGYGYEVKALECAPQVVARGKDFVAAHEHQVQWVVDKFGQKSAADLEILSTLVYVDHEFRDDRRTADISDLIATVHEVKPHHTTERIRREAEWLKAEGMLASID